MSAQRTMIEVSNLHKHYGAIHAVNGISFSIDRGEIVGFLGPNGAGKSTTMKILTSYIAPTHGAVRVAGYDILTDSMNVRRRVGYLPEETPLYKTMAVIDFLKYVAAVREVPARRVKERLREVVDVCGVYEVLGQTIGTLSKGYRQRVGLAQALIHDPDILILDEPTSGLDPNQISEIRSVIKELGKEKTLILSTHILPEVEATCDRVIIIDRGLVVGDGSQADLAKARKAQSGYIITLDGQGTDDEMRSALEKVDGMKSVSATASESHTFIVTPVMGEDPRLELMRLCVDKSWTISELTGHMASLEDIFRELTQRGGLATDEAEGNDDDIDDDDIDDDNDDDDIDDDSDDDIDDDGDDDDDIDDDDDGDDDDGDDSDDDRDDSDDDDGDDEEKK